MSHRLWIFGALLVAILGAAGVYLALAIRGAPDATVSEAVPESPPEPLPEDRPFAIFRRTSMDALNGQLAVVELTDPASPRFVSTMTCERIHMAAGRGVCLAGNPMSPARARARIFDGTWSAISDLDLSGIPSRVQVSPDGKLAATTVFVTGHSYADGGFSTRTSVIDLDRRAWLVEDLETFTVRKDGREIRSIDFNFWGVTFTRSGRTFYATLGSGTSMMLVRGDVDARTLDVVADAVECPSLSPDNRRIAFKQRVGGLFAGVRWQIWVLDLSTLERHRLAETRSVDDQVQWLDDERVLYALPDEARSAVMNEWVVPADGSGEPSMFLPQAYSAAIVRP